MTVSLHISGRGARCNELNYAACIAELQDDHAMLEQRLLTADLSDVEALLGLPAGGSAQAGRA